MRDDFRAGIPRIRRDIRRFSDKPTAMGIGRVLEENARLRELVADQERLLAEKAQQLEAVIASNEELSRRLALLREKTFGRKNERYVAGDSLMLPFDAMPPPPPRVPVADIGERESPAPAASKPKEKPRRRDVSDLTTLPSRPLRCRRDPAVTCNRCGGDLKTIGDDVSWRIDWVPGHFERLEVRREKCACPKCPGEGVLIAPEPPFALPRALCGNRLLARVIVDKHLDRAPLNLQAKRMAREGFEVSTAVLSNWVLEAAKLLERVAKAIDERLLSQPWLQGDDTGFPVQDGTDGHLRKGRLWCYTDQQEVRYHFSDTKGGKNPAKFLADFDGSALLVDCGSEFNQVVRERGVARAGCWSHLRRYFFDARLHHPIEAHLVLGTIRDLFAIERSLAGATLEAIHEVRQRDSKPLVDGLFSWIAGLSQTVRPKSGLGDAIRYARNHESEFRLFLNRADLPMHNNLSELQLRGPVVGRKAWLFAGSEGGAHAAATMFTLMGSCILQGIDPMQWLVDVLDRLPDHPAHRVHELTPLNWRLAQEGQAAAK